MKTKYLTPFVLLLLFIPTAIAQPFENIQIPTTTKAIILLLINVTVIMFSIAAFSRIKPSTEFPYINLLSLAVGFIILITFVVTVSYLL